MTTVTTEVLDLGGYEWSSPTARARLFAKLMELAVTSGRTKNYLSDLYHDAMWLSQMEGNETFWFIARTDGTHIFRDESLVGFVRNNYENDGALAVWRFELSTGPFDRAVATITQI